MECHVEVRQYLLEAFEVSLPSCSCSIVSLVMMITQQLSSVGLTDIGMRCWWKGCFFRFRCLWIKFLWHFREVIECLSEFIKESFPVPFDFVSFSRRFVTPEPFGQPAPAAAASSNAGKCETAHGYIASFAGVLILSSSFTIHIRRCLISVFLYRLQRSLLPRRLITPMLVFPGTTSRVR